MKVELARLEGTVIVLADFVVVDIVVVVVVDIVVVDVVLVKVVFCGPAPRYPTARPFKFYWFNVTNLKLSKESSDFSLSWAWSS